MMASLRTARLYSLVRAAAALLFGLTPGFAVAQYPLPPIVEPGTAHLPEDTGQPTADTGGPVRMARLSLVEGDVRLGLEGSNTWSQASINLILSQHNSLYTASNSRAEIRFDDGSMLRMAPGTSVTIQVLFSDLDGEFTEIKVAQGTVTMRTIDRGSIVQLDAPHFAARATGPSEIRLDVTDKSALSALVGTAQLDGPASSSTVTTGNRATATESGGNVQVTMTALGPPDAWDQWNFDRDRLLDSAAQDESADLPPNIVVAEPDTCVYGEWGVITGLGHVWYPHVPTDWRPYAHGHWAWVNPYGLTWISSEPWGWAPYHYGAWLKTSYGWAWAPGPANQYWAPAVVNMRERDGEVIWVPLAPREVHYPDKFTVGRPGSAWVTKYSVPRCGVYYPVNSNVCEGRPWTTLDILKSQQKTDAATSWVVVTPNHNTVLRSEAFIPVNGYSGGASKASVAAVQSGGKNEAVPADQYAAAVDSHTVGPPAGGGPPVLAPIGFHPLLAYVGQVPGRSMPAPAHTVVINGRTISQPAHTGIPAVGQPRSGPTIPGRSEPHPGGSQPSGGGSHGAGNSSGGGGHSGGSSGGGNSGGGGGHSGGGSSGGGGGHSGKG